MRKFWKVIILIFVVGIMAGDLLIDYQAQVQAHPQENQAVELQVVTSPQNFLARRLTVELYL